MTLRKELITDIQFKQTDPFYTAWIVCLTCISGNGSILSESQPAFRIESFGTVFVGIKHLCSPLSISYALAMVHLKRERIHARNTSKLCSSLGKRCSFSLRVLSGIFVQKNNLRRHLQKQQIGSNKAFCDSLGRLS